MTRLIKNLIIITVIMVLHGCRYGPPLCSLMDNSGKCLDYIFLGGNK